MAKKFARRIRRTHTPSFKAREVHNAEFIGGLGTCKTHLATALAVQAIKARQADAVFLYRGVGQRP